MIYPTSESVEAMQKCINDVQGNKNVENKLKINDDKIEFMNTNPSHFTMTPINV